MRKFLNKETKKMEEEGLVPPIEKRGRGRPKGSKNKKKTESKNEQSSESNK